MFPIIVPSLVERIVDLPVIVEFMLNELKINGENIPKFDQSTLKNLVDIIDQETSESLEMLLREQSGTLCRPGNKW